ncbi:MAG TPA: DUF5677 domain-containing protein [Bryobacteraceae bacterium]|nr:DUF5677 domain-containing protein [Bryobacteraceae bacterium]
MGALAAKNEAASAVLLSLFSDYRQLTERVISRPSSYASERPQDYVASLLAVRCFRLAVGAILLSQSGYPDLAVDAARPIWEIAIRLCDLGRDPVPAALGYLLRGVWEELIVMEAELRYRSENGLDVGNLPRNIGACRAYQSSLELRARSLGHDPRVISNRYGRLNVRQVCKDLGVEKSYLVDYKFFSTHAHSLAAATDDAVKERGGRRELIFGPIADGAFESAFDTLRNLGVAMCFVAQVVDDPMIAAEAERLIGLLEKIRSSMRRGATRGTGPDEGMHPTSQKRGGR